MGVVLIVAFVKFWFSNPGTKHRCFINAVYAFQIGFNPYGLIPRRKRRGTSLHSLTEAIIHDKISNNYHILTGLLV